MAALPLERGCCILTSAPPTGTHAHAVSQDEINRFYKIFHRWGLPSLWPRQRWQRSHATAPASPCRHGRSIDKDNSNEVSLEEFYDFMKLERSPWMDRVFTIMGEALSPRLAVEAAASRAPWRARRRRASRCR